MKLLLVTSVEPTTRSVATVHKYATTGKALGHTVAVFGEPRSDMPLLPFTTDLNGVDLALFIVQVPSDFPDMPHLARLLDGVPRERRAISKAPSSSVGTLSKPAERRTMRASSSGV